jgi:hypothetical protein
MTATLIPSSSFGLGAPPLAGALAIGDGSPERARATERCWARCQELRLGAAQAANPARASRERIRTETGIRVDENPYVGITANEIDAVVRAAYTSHQPPEVLLALWAKEGSTRSIDDWVAVAGATSEANARTMLRNRVYYVDLGVDHFIVTRREPGDNVYDASDAAAPGHERHFAERVRALVAERLLSEDLSGAINAELAVRGSAAGGFEVRPSVRFYALSLLLADALFTKMQRTSHTLLPSIPAAMNYLQWNMGERRFGEFLASADRHRREPAFGAQPISIERWALHTVPRAREWRQPRANAIRFLHYLDSYRPIFEASMNLIRPSTTLAPAQSTIAFDAPPAPAIEDLRYDRTGTACARGPSEGARALLAELRARFQGRSGGIFNCRPVRGGSRLSLHGEGRAVDWMLNAGDPAQAAEAQRIVDWLLGPDAQGNAHALARRMGIQEIIWNRQIWSAGRAAQGWRPYGGVNPHTDHLHIGLNRAGAAMETSYWRSRAAAPDPPAAQALSIPSSRLSWDGATEEQSRFMRAVYDRHVANASRSREFVEDVPASDLALVEEGQRMRTEAATRCRALLAAARAALDRDKAAGDALAQGCEWIKAGSGYRSSSTQFSSWQRNFPRYYERTRAERARLEGGEHGAAAVAHLARFIGGWLGAPGYSLHNDGRAMDFRTRQGGHDLGASSAAASIERWKASWLWRWLKQHAGEFGFVEYAREPWHWNFRGQAPAPTRGQSLAAWADPLALGRGVARGGYGTALNQPVAAGRLVVASVPLLSAHRGTPPDLVLKWNAMPAPPAAVDVVVHLHGFSRFAERMRIDTAKEAISGLDFSPPAGAPGSWSGRSEPTLLVLPRGNFYGGRSGRGYDFPALVRAGGVDALVAFALGQFATHAQAASVRRRRLILTAHSGGGAPLMHILGQQDVDPDELHVFDATYGATTNLAAWARRRIARDAAALAAGVPDAAAYMRERGGACRVFYIRGTATERQALAARTAIAGALAAAAPNVRAVLEQYYRVEPSAVGHNQVPAHYGGRLLANAAATI